MEILRQAQDDKRRRSQSLSTITPTVIPITPTVIPITPTVIPITRTVIPITPSVIPTEAVESPDTCTQMKTPKNHSILIQDEGKEAPLFCDNRIS